MSTRFIKPKIDKYIQLHSRYSKNETGVYGSISAVLGSTIDTDASYSSPPILTITEAPSGGVNATAICTIGSNGFINSIIITNAGERYTEVPTITAPLGTITGTSTGSNTQPFVVSLNLDRRRIYTWDLINEIVLNENGKVSLIDKLFDFEKSDIELYTKLSNTIYTFRLLDFNNQSIIKTKDLSTLKQSYVNGPVLNTGYPDNRIINAVDLEIAPQIIRNISISVDEGITDNKGINPIIDFNLTLKILEQEPQFIEYGSLNNININQN